MKLERWSDVQSVSGFLEFQLDKFGELYLVHAQEYIFLLCKISLLEVFCFLFAVFRAFYDTFQPICYMRFDGDFQGLLVCQTPGDVGGLSWMNHPLSKLGCYTKEQNKSQGNLIYMQYRTYSGYIFCRINCWVEGSASCEIIDENNERTLQNLQIRFARLQTYETTSSCSGGALVSCWCR